MINNRLKYVLVTINNNSHTLIHVIRQQQHHNLCHNHKKRLLLPSSSYHSYKVNPVFYIFNPSKQQLLLNHHRHITTGSHDGTITSSISNTKRLFATSSKETDSDMISYQNTNDTCSPNYNYTFDNSNSIKETPYSIVESKSSTCIYAYSITLERILSVLDRSTEKVPDLKLLGELFSQFVNMPLSSSPLSSINNPLKNNELLVLPFIKEYMFIRTLAKIISVSKLKEFRHSIQQGSPIKSSASLNSNISSHKTSPTSTENRNAIRQKSTNSIHTFQARLLAIVKDYPFMIDILEKSYNKWITHEKQLNFMLNAVEIYQEQGHSDQFLASLKTFVCSHPIRPENKQKNSKMQSSTKFSEQLESLLLFINLKYLNDSKLNPKLQDMIAIHKSIIEINPKITPFASSLLITRFINARPRTESLSMVKYKHSLDAMILSLYTMMKNQNIPILVGTYIHLIQWKRATRSKYQTNTKELIPNFIQVLSKLPMDSFDYVLSQLTSSNDIHYALDIFKEMIKKGYIASEDSLKTLLSVCQTYQLIANGMSLIQYAHELGLLRSILPETLRFLSSCSNSSDFNDFASTSSTKWSTTSSLSSGSASISPDNEIITPEYVFHLAYPEGPLQWEPISIASLAEHYFKTNQIEKVKSLLTLYQFTGKSKEDPHLKRLICKFYLMIGKIQEAIRNFMFLSKNDTSLGSYTSEDQSLHLQILESAIDLCLNEQVLNLFKSFQDKYPHFSIPENLISKYLLLLIKHNNDRSSEPEDKSQFFEQHIYLFISKHSNLPIFNSETPFLKDVIIWCAKHKYFSTVEKLIFSSDFHHIKFNNDPIFHEKIMIQLCDLHSLDCTATNLLLECSSIFFKAATATTTATTTTNSVPEINLSSNHPISQHNYCESKSELDNPISTSQSIDSPLSPSSHTLEKFICAILVKSQMKIDQAIAYIQQLLNTYPTILETNEIMLVYLKSLLIRGRPCEARDVLIKMHRELGLTSGSYIKYTKWVRASINHKEIFPGSKSHKYVVV